jgi:ubiquitin-protein ligase
MFNFKKKAPSSTQKKPDRAEQLQSDYRRVSGLFKSHPFISIKESSGSPPDRYRILYRIDGLQKVKNTIETKNEHEVEIVLPQKYPAADPVCTRISPIFHPNIAPEIIDIKGLWGGSATLADLIVDLGRMIAFQKYDTANPLNTEAAKWADRNKDLIPLSKADLNYREDDLDSDEAPGTEVIIQDQVASDTPPPEDGRKTEGIIISSDSSPFRLEEEISSNDDKAVEMRKTTLLEKAEDTKILSRVPEPQKPKQPAASATAPVKQAARVEPKPATAPTPPPVKQAVHQDSKPAPAPTPPPVKQVVRQEQKPTPPTPPPVKQVVREEQKPTPAPTPSPVKQAVREEPKPTPAPTPPPLKQAVREEPKPAPTPPPVKQAVREELKVSPVPPVIKEEQPQILPKDKETEWSMKSIPAATTLKETVAPLTDDDFFCWQCGARNRRGANFCSNCGTKLWQEVTAVKKGSPTKILLLSSFIVIPLAIITAGITLIFTQKAKQVQVTPPAAVEEKKPQAVIADTTPAPIIAVPKADTTAEIAKKTAPPTADGIARKLSGALSPEQKQAKIEENLKSAQLYLNLGSFDQAVSKYMYVLKLEPNNDDALDGLRQVREARDKAESGKPAGADSTKK